MVERCMAFRQDIRKKKLTGCFTFPDGGLEYYSNGKRHREDGPAVISIMGDRLWYYDDKPHRLDGPAYEEADGTKSWFLHGELHREDGPAMELPDGRRLWFRHGKETAPN